MLKKKNIKVIQIILLLIPFFELQSWSQLAEQSIAPHFFEGILSVYSGLRLVISMFVVLDTISKNRISRSTTTICILVFVVLENISSLLNGSLYLRFTIGSFALFGFALLCQESIHRNRREFISACKILFGALSIIGAIQIILMPYGFLNARYKAYAIYLLGSKNSSFFYYVVYIFFSFYDDIENYKKIGKKSFAMIAIFVVAAFSCESMNTLMMLLMISVFAIAINYSSFIRQILKPWYVIAVVVTVAVILLNSAIRELLTPILNLIGRDATFTGRDVLWYQAIHFFKKRPFAGNGILTEYRLIDGVMQDNAHSQFLDLLAKYGVFVFATYISIPILALAKVVKKDKWNSRIIALKSSIAFVVMFHSIIDHMTMFHFILLMSSIELIRLTNSIQKVPGWIKSY